MLLSRNSVAVYQAIPEFRLDRFVYKTSLPSETGLGFYMELVM